MLYIIIVTMDYFVRFIELLIFVRVLMSWLPVDVNRGIPGLIYSLTEPLLGPIRNMLRRSPIGGLMIDISPVILIFLIDMVYRLLVTLLLQI